MDRKQATEALIFVFVTVVVLWSMRPRRTGREGGWEASYSYGANEGSQADGGSGADGCDSGGGGGGDGGGGD